MALSTKQLLFCLYQQSVKPRKILQKQRELCAISIKQTKSSIDQALQKQNIFFKIYSNKEVTIPSPINNHLIDKEPITGVIIKGNKVIKITGPLIYLPSYLHIVLNTKPKIRTKGNVKNVNVIANSELCRNL